MIPDVSRETVLDAITRFDSDLRDSPGWQGWEDNATYKYAIDYNGQHYPVKQIISMATNTDLNAFSGGSEANRYVRERGFGITKLAKSDSSGIEQQSLQSSFEKILTVYPQVATRPYGRVEDIWEPFESVKQTIVQIINMQGYTNFHVEWSVGKGRWASVPWVAILDERFTTSTESGVYCAYLIRQDMTGVYLTLNQGITDALGAGRVQGLQTLKSRAKEIRERVPELESHGYRRDDYIDLKSSSSRGKAYESSIIAYKYYEKGMIPQDESLVEDVKVLLNAYAAYVESSTIQRSVNHWIFQSNPEYFDAISAIRNLSEMTWLVKQHKGSIRMGDQVFIWESGDSAGIIATATVLSTPEEIEESVEERQYNKTEEQFDGQRLRVKMHIDHVLPQRLLRTELKNLPGLASLSIFRMAQGTNFEVTPEQAQIIQALVNRKGGIGDVIPPNIKSWSYMPNELGLIGIKRIDWSMFNDGTHIPLDYNAKFDEANDGESIVRGEWHPVTLVIGNMTYGARIFNFKVKNYAGNSYSLRWESNHELLDLLKMTFKRSYQYITLQRGEQSDGSKPQVIVPDTIAEYIAFYKTETPYTYRAVLKPYSGDVIAMTLTQAMSDLIKSIVDRGFIYEPWQIAAYVTALRTKPFVILAGVTGTGKSKLPKLVTTVTGGVSQLIPVRPDWTDSSEVLGYVDLQGKFRPGKLLTFAQAASLQHDRHHVAIIDEMNLARVEHYFAEVLSGIEDRTVSPLGGFESCPLLNTVLSADDQAWQEQCLPSNLAIVGTVNMDESAHGFSRKVLDRTFTLEISDIDLTQWYEAITSPLAILQWPVHFWYPRAIQLAGLQHLTDTERRIVNQVIDILTTLNQTLVQAQLQVGYRTRDEIALFTLHAQEIAEFFVTRSDERVDPIDLAILMKVLPRIVGGSMAIRRVLLELVAWATGSQQQVSDDIITVLQPWVDAGRPSVQPGARYPRTAARLYLMLDRLQSEGYTSFWL